MKCGIDVVRNKYIDCHCMVCKKELGQIYFSKKTTNKLSDCALIGTICCECHKNLLQ